jgi:hypothetical protein
MIWLIQSDFLDEKKTIKDEIIVLNEKCPTSEKLLINVHYLRPIDKLLQNCSQIDLLTCLYNMSNFTTYYPYCVNVDRYVKNFADLLYWFTKECNKNDIQGYIKKFERDISSTSTSQFLGISLNVKIKSYQFSDIKYVLDASLLYEILAKYDNDDDNNKCKYCSSTIPKDRLVHPCKCIDPVHIECLLKWMSNGGGGAGKCEICNDTYSKINEKRILCNGSADTNIFFPFDNFYPIPLITNNLINKTTQKLGSAICYLQTNRVDNLLSNSKSDLGDYSEILSCFKMKCVPSLYFYNYNKEAYIAIENLLKKHGIM